MEWFNRIFSTYKEWKMDFWTKFGTAAKLAACLVVAGAASLALPRFASDLFKSTN
jgi:hypothetical protein